MHPAAEVIVLEEFVSWYRELDDSDANAVNRYVDLLSAKGVALGHPYSSAIRNSNHALRELRVQSGGRPLRILYAFDPGRNAVLILGGDKTGNDRFYMELIPRADRLYAAYLANTGQSTGVK